jgi:hypothetical protein
MANQIDHDKLVEHARKLDSEARQWTERQLRSTYSSEHLSSKPRSVDGGTVVRQQPTATGNKNSD